VNRKLTKRASRSENGYRRPWEFSRKGSQEENQSRDESGAQGDKSRNGEADIENAAGDKGTLEVRMAYEQEGKMACSKVVNQKAITDVEKVDEVC
jgi:hypothetical protein